VYDTLVTVESEHPLSSACHRRYVVSYLAPNGHRRQAILVNLGRSALVIGNRYNAGLAETDGKVCRFEVSIG
jgi:hypothetical protein